MARVFIASASRELARSAAAAVRSAGHLPVSTWHADDAPADDFQALRATMEVEGANVLVLIVSGGRADLGEAYWLTGYAVRSMCRVIVFNAGGIEFMRHPHHEHVEHLPALLALLATVEDRNAKKH
jgi:hypothetical protein